MVIKKNDNLVLHPIVKRHISIIISMSEMNSPKYHSNRIFYVFDMRRCSGSHFIIFHWTVQMWCSFAQPIADSKQKKNGAWKKKILKNIEKPWWHEALSRKEIQFFSNYANIFRRIWHKTVSRHIMVVISFFSLPFLLYSSFNFSQPVFLLLRNHERVHV